MIDPRAFRTTEVLRNGLAVTIRAIRPGDKAGILDAFFKLDPESIRTRFFTTKESLSDGELKAATEVDFGTVVALVVTIGAEGGETIIGGGRYIAFDRPGVRSAEIAFMVEEDYSGLGIAGRVLNQLTRIARDRGVAQFEAEVLPQNEAMLAVFRRSGLPMRVSPGEDAVHVTLSLAEPSGR